MSTKQNALAKKIALITGGTTGIGFATAKRFFDEGAHVIVTGRNPDTLAHARSEFGDKVEVIASDAADPKAITALFADIKKKHGGLDVLFLNAGVAHMAPLGMGDEAHFDAIFNVNVKGPWLALSAAASVLNDNASVMINTSVVNEIGMPGSSAYAASKAAVRSLVRVAAAEWKDKHIRVNALAPGAVETPIYNKMGMPEADLAGFQAGMTAQVPLGRFGRPDELANAALFLASDASSYVNGIELKVDGGFTSI